MSLVPDALVDLLDAELMRSPYKERALGRRHRRDQDIARRLAAVLVDNDELVRTALDQAARRKVWRA